MNLNPFGNLSVLTSEISFKVRFPNCFRTARLRVKCLTWLLLAFACLGFNSAVQAQAVTAPAATVAVIDTSAMTPAEKIAALQLEMTNAWGRVIQIVNQPVNAYVRSRNMHVSVYHPGWFHEGATRPDFNSVDVRQTQDLGFAKNQYVTSDLNPGVAFLGRDLEFNSMTKFFYVNRSLPKHRLSEAQMLEINRLYRIIGRCETELARLQTPVESESKIMAESAAAPGTFIEGIQRIPREQRALYGGIAIGTLVVLMFAARLLRRRSG